jgi:uncharacterized protein with FMN-binding domain
MTTKKKRIIIIVAIILAVLTAIFLFVTDGLSEVMNTPLVGIDLSEVPDGSYTGVYEFKRWSNTVVVHIKDNRITAIDIEKDMSGAEITNCAEEIIRRVIAEQNTIVDAVTGATVSSKAYLMAIEDAIND